MTTQNLPVNEVQSGLEPGFSKAATGPQAGDMHVNRPLTNYSQVYMQDDSVFVAQDAMPNLPVAKQADLYWEFPKGEFFLNQAEERADGTETAGGDFTVSTNPYFCRVYGFHKNVSDRQRANSDSEIALDRTAVRFVTSTLMLRREIDFANTYMKTGVWSTDLTGVTSGPNATQFIQWDQAASDPIADIRDGKRVVQESTTYRPNKMLIGRAGFDALLDNDSILERILGGASTALPAMLMKQRLAELLELDAIHVMDAVYNSAAKGAAPVMTFIGGKDALLYYAPETVGLEEVTAGVQFSWTGYLGATQQGMRISNLRMDNIRADRIEGEMSYDYKLTGADLGYFFSGVVA